MAFVYPASGAVDETAPVGHEIAEMHGLHARRRAGGGPLRGTAAVVGVVLRLGLLYGPGTGSDEPAERFPPYGATLRIEDAVHRAGRGADHAAETFTTW